jgi:hypothetical protein
MLTNVEDLLDLTASRKGYRNALLADVGVVLCCCCSCSKTSYQ